MVNAMLLQDIRPHTINHAFWSIAVEWHIYFFFPLLVFCWHRVGPRTTLLCTFAVAYALFFALEKTSWIGITPWYLGLFALGMYAAGSTGTPKSENTREGHWGIVAGLFALFAALLFDIFGWQWTMSHYALVDLPVGICAAAVLACVSNPIHRIHRVLSLPAFVWVGSFAYSVYLIHAPLIQVIWQYLLNPLRFSDSATFFLLLTGGSTLIIACAYLFHLLFERPFMSKPGVKVTTDTQAEIAAAVSPAP